MNEIFKILILGILIIIVLVYAKLQKAKTTEGFDDLSDGLVLDADNPTLTDDQLYGSVPQAASASIYNKVELKGQITESALNSSMNNNADGKPRVSITTIAVDTTNPDDIQNQLNAAIVEGFVVADLINTGLGQTGGVSSAASAIGGNSVAGTAIANNALQTAQDKAVEKGTDVVKKQLLKKNAAKAAAKAAGKTGASVAKKVGIKSAVKVVKKIGSKIATKVGAKVAVKIMEKIAIKLAEKIAIMAAKAAGLAVATTPTIVLPIILLAFAGYGVTLSTIIAIVYKGEDGYCPPGTTPSKVPSEALDWMPVIGDILGSIVPYLCSSDGCNDGLEENAGLCYAKCKEGYKSDGATMCYKQYPEFENNGMSHTLTSVTKKILTDTGLAGTVCDGELKAGLCYPKCDPPYIGGATTCTYPATTVGAGISKLCPPGWGDGGALCTEPITYDGCPSGSRDDGLLCYKDTLESKSKGSHWEDPWWDGCCSRGAFNECYGCARGGGTKYDACPDGWKDDGIATCWKGGSVPKGSHGGSTKDKLTDTSLTCPQDHPDWIDGLCYKSCPTGLNHVYLAPTQCAPARGFSYDRGVGKVLKCASDRIALVPDIVKGYRAPTSDTDAFLCYGGVPSGYTRKNLGTLDQNCPAGTTDFGVGCTRESYSRGIGVAKFKLVMANPDPPPDPPPLPSSDSANFNDDPSTSCHVDFASQKMLQDMTQFYYSAAIQNKTTNSDGTFTFSYVSKVVSVVASSEQSADVLCDITTAIVNPSTGATVSTSVTTGNDRRFYFAIVKTGSVCVFITTGSTNANGTAPDVKSTENPPVSVSFAPSIKQCANSSLSYKQCSSPETIKAMVALYQKQAPPTIQVQYALAVDATDTNVCTLVWSEVTFDPATNAVGSIPVTKAGKFTFSLDSSNVSCAYTLQSYAPTDATVPIKPLPTPLEIEVPLPKQTKLQGCSTDCTEPELLKTLISGFNAKGANRMINITRIFTPTPLRCDVEANIYNSETGAEELHTVRFDLAAPASGCATKIAAVGELDSGLFIQPNTPAAPSNVTSADFAIKTQTAALKDVGTALGETVKKFAGITGKANNIADTVFSDVGQEQTLSDCSVKCTDPAILDAIMTTYNSDNYPNDRNNVTQKTMTRILKVGTADPSTCEVSFEVRSDVYSDFYTSAPKTTTTTKTQKFNMEDNGDCTFTVTSSGRAPVAEGFKGSSSRFGSVAESFVPSKRKEGFQDAGLPGVAAAATKKKKKAKHRSVVNPLTPSMAPPYMGTNCSLKCDDRDLMNSIRDSYEVVAEEGFTNYMGNWLSGGWFKTLREAFQDGTYDSVDDTSAEAAVVTLKKVNKAVRTGSNTCEYEIVYDEDNGDGYPVSGEVGYFQATVAQDTTGCSFSLTDVTPLDAPIIPTLPKSAVKTVNYRY